MSLRCLGGNRFSFYRTLSSGRQGHAIRLQTTTTAMSFRPNYQGGRRGGGGGRGGGRRGGGGGRGGGRGEQRWWDPVWRAERLGQKAAEVFSRVLIVAEPLFL